MKIKSTTKTNRSPCVIYSISASSKFKVLSHSLGTCQTSNTALSCSSVLYSSIKGRFWPKKVGTRIKSILTHYLSYRFL